MHKDCCAKQIYTISVAVSIYQITFILDSAVRHLKEMANWRDWFDYLRNHLREW